MRLTSEQIADYYRSKAPERVNTLTTKELIHQEPAITVDTAERVISTRLHVPITSIQGIGDHYAVLIKNVAGSEVIDLLWHLPTRFVDRRATPRIKRLNPIDWPAGSVVTMRGVVRRHIPRINNLPWTVVLEDGDGILYVVYFNADGGHLRKLFPDGQERVVSGTLTYRDRDGKPQIAHPEYVAEPEQADQIPQIEPIYSLTSGLTSRTVTRSVQRILHTLPHLPEWLCPEMLAERGWADWHASVQNTHSAMEAIDPRSPVRERLAYDELLANQLMIALTRQERQQLPGRSFCTENLRLPEIVRKGLEFTLTDNQETVLREIEEDMRSPHQMMRLLQGDVGSGKTVVALLAMLIAVESGGQAALLTPTEVLARQHHQVLQRLVAPAGVEVGLLTGREKGRERATALKGLADGTTPIVVGTHALLQQSVEFHDLAFAVIDEQHRFGVEQQAELTRRVSRPDILLLSATPIPRTLELAAYGSMDTSRLREKPVNRRPITTTAVTSSCTNEIKTIVVRAIANGSKTFWICPTIDAAGRKVVTAEKRYAELQKLAPGRVGLIHGRIKGADRDRIMDQFVHGGVGVLVATTIIEVGIDVPQATIIVIENAERFGLAQLHQLRGRVGRGSEASRCYLIHPEEIGPVARQRLDTLCATEDGFVIAERDLRLRGPGEVLGTQQSGVPLFHLANLSDHEDLVELAQKEARETIDSDPTLTTQRGRALRVLLHLFRKELPF